MKDKNVKVAIAMSGGVDSSVAAKILLDQGYEVVGFMMNLWSDPTCKTKRANSCCDIEGVLDARRVAAKLGIPFYLVDAREVFRKEIVDDFIHEYEKLNTPNPCTRCNRLIKFGWLLDYTTKLGFDYLATGHYARIEKGKDGFHLFKGRDKNKDQSYFLYNLTQEKLAKILFPVGGKTKEEVRKLAKEWNLPVYDKKESQEICFIQDKDYREFLRRNIPKKFFTPGNIINKKGEVLGEHTALINYTIGQRKGIEQFGGKGEDKKSLYVIGYDAKNNNLIIGSDRDVYQKDFQLVNVNFIQNKAKVDKVRNLKVKIRYRHEAVSCKVQTASDSPLNINFRKSQRAVTPGQSAVLYSGDEVLGGGIIKNA